MAKNKAFIDNLLILVYNLKRSSISFGGRMSKVIVFPAPQRQRRKRTIVDVPGLEILALIVVAVFWALWLLSGRGVSEYHANVGGAALTATLDIMFVPGIVLASRLILRWLNMDSKEEIIIATISGVAATMMWGVEFILTAILISLLVVWFVQRNKCRIDR